MPLYEYECEGCGSRTEVLQRVGAPPIGPCGACGGAMRRLISAPAFQFKGTGWYVTDYARKKPATDKAKPATDQAKPAAEAGSAKKGGEAASSPASSSKETGKGSDAASS